MQSNRLFSLYSYRSIHSSQIRYSSGNDKLKQYYRDLKIPFDSNHETIKNAYIALAKRYHPDSGSSEICPEKFCRIEHAFKELSKYKIGKVESIENKEFDIRHTAPQHRQYLTYNGVGSGTPFQRRKTWMELRAQNAASNVLKHKIEKHYAAEGDLIKKGEDSFTEKHDIKTKYGFDRLVEDLIQESIAKGEFDNLSGTGKPLKEQHCNPYVDFTTHKINEVLINNGFVPEWITLNKTLREEMDCLEDQLCKERSVLGKYPLSDKDMAKWKNICEYYRETAKNINVKINKFNLIVPLLNKQMVMINFDKYTDYILKNGEYGQLSNEDIIACKPERDVLLDFLNSVFSFFGIFDNNKTRK